MCRLQRSPQGLLGLGNGRQGKEEEEEKEEKRPGLYVATKPKLFPLSLYIKRLPTPALNQDTSHTLHSYQERLKKDTEAVDRNLYPQGQGVRYT